jgi:hypothetical protein
MVEQLGKDGERQQQEHKKLVDQLEKDKERLSKEYDLLKAQLKESSQCRDEERQRADDSRYDARVKGLDARLKEKEYILEFNHQRHVSEATSSYECYNAKYQKL